MAFVAAIDLDDINLFDDGANVELCPSGDAYVTRKASETSAPFTSIFFTSSSGAVGYGG